VKFLIDEMFSHEVAAGLRSRSHDAWHVRDVGLNGASDADVLGYAVAHDLVVVTENAVDYVLLLNAAAGAGQSTPAVVLTLKRQLPRQAPALARELAHRLARWADAHPNPYRHIHWLG